MADRIAVVYTSNYGSAKQYAQWISEETGAEVFESSKCKAKELENFDTIIVGGGILAGSIEGIGFLKKNIKKLMGKKIIAYAVGLNVYDQKSCDECLEKNFTRKISGIPCFFLPGEYFPEKVTKGDRMLMNIVISRLEGKSHRTEDENLMLNVMKNGGDLKSKGALEPLYNFMRDNGIL